MERLTPLVQPLSIDEAVLDLSGTAALHGAPPAVVLARFARQVEQEVGVTVSVGLARNRLLAKIAAGRDKPRGFCVIGAEAPALLAGEPVGLLPGIGPAFARRLAGLGITRLGHLQALDARAARRMLGDDGPALVRRALGEDDRPVDPRRATKSVSAETTFDTDLAAPEALERHLWRLSEKLARRLREADLAAEGVVLEAQDEPLRAAHPQPPPGPAEAPARPAVRRGRARCWRARRCHGVPPDRHRRAAAGAGRGGRPPRPRRAGARPAGGSPGGDRRAARALWGGHDRARAGDG